MKGTKTEALDRWPTVCRATMGDLSVIVAFNAALALAAASSSEARRHISPATRWATRRVLAAIRAPFGYLPFHSGSRFSMKAAIPSIKSSL